MSDERVELWKQFAKDLEKAYKELEGVPVIVPSKVLALLFAEPGPVLVKLLGEPNDPA